MENENRTPENLSHLEDYFKDYKQKKKEAQNNKIKTKEEILAKYFNPRGDREVFRILPPKKGKKFVEEAFFHEIKQRVAGGKITNSKIYCPKHNDPKIPKLDINGNPVLEANGNPVMILVSCPLCEKYDQKLAEQDPSLKGVDRNNLNETQKMIKAKNDELYKEAMKFKAKKFHIIRGIDRNAEIDGVKFWRFKDDDYRRQGALDKLLPILEEYYRSKGKDFTDVKEGVDLIITSVDAYIPATKKTFRQISAISRKEPSPLHGDIVVVNQWINDEISWRDVFLPKKAPNVTEDQYLKLVVEGNSPYWDDTDSNNKRWVFPNHPELEKLANTRKLNLDADSKTSNFEQASDIGENSDSVTISTIEKTDVGVYKDNAIDIGAEIVNASSDTKYDDQDNYDSYDDLPF